MASLHERVRAIQQHAIDAETIVGNAIPIMRDPHPYKEQPAAAAQCAANRLSQAV